VVSLVLRGVDGPLAPWQPGAHIDLTLPNWLTRQYSLCGDPAGIFDMGVTYLPPARAEWQLLAGDETAVPAILSILEHAPPDLAADVYLEVPETADIREVEAPEGVRVHWLPRDEPGRPPGTLALETIRRAELREGRSYTWVAGESRLATGLRRHLTGERGVPKSDIAFFGYWRQGRSSPG